MEKAEVDTEDLEQLSFKRNKIPEMKTETNAMQKITKPLRENFCTRENSIKAWGVQGKSKDSVVKIASKTSEVAVVA